ncbi:hypothetical protein [Neptuniibacter sp. QD37_11]|uniref:hypothetical protein n=1 Tax=Neptuniibacter sp. QD37_11 TaxID=3398209 RepID=UPI0039F46CC8
MAPNPSQIAKQGLLTIGLIALSISSASAEVTENEEQSKIHFSIICENGFSTGLTESAMIGSNIIQWHDNKSQSMQYREIENAVDKCTLHLSQVQPNKTTNITSRRQSG